MELLKGLFCLCWKIGTAFVGALVIMGLCVLFYQWVDKVIYTTGAMGTTCFMVFVGFVCFIIGLCNGEKI